MESQDPSFWKAIYQAEGKPGWDMGAPTPLVEELLEAAAALGLVLGPRVAVPGCGFGHDAAEFARRGHQVTGVDFAEEALRGARERHGDLVQWRLEDWFTADLGPFDCIFDHTCFVAIPPARREEFVEACARRLQPGGLWLGAFFHTVKEPGGPPYAVDLEDVRRLASPAFEVRYLEPAMKSHPRRAGREFILVAVRR
jgi:SAM-dependent methyltransferase